MNANTTTTTWIGAVLDRCKLILVALACVAVLFSISVGGNLAAILCAVAAIGFAVVFFKHLRGAAATGASSVSKVDAKEDDGEDDAGQPLLDAMLEEQETEFSDMQLSPQYSSLLSNVFHNS